MADRASRLLGSGIGAVEPYARRVAHDPKLRRHAGNAVGSAQRLSGMLGSDRRAWAARLATDADVQRELRELATELRETGRRLQKPQRSHRMLRWLVTIGMLLVIARALKAVLHRNDSDESLQPDSGQ